MTEMQQILVGMNKLNERVHNAEARATEAERQAQEIQQELVRAQAVVKGKGKGAAVPLQQTQGTGAFASKYQPQLFESEDDKWREWAQVFRNWSGRFLVAHWSVAMWRVWKVMKEELSSWCVQCSRAAFTFCTFFALTIGCTFLFADIFCSDLLEDE